jgi:GLPGLI family protein
MCKNIAAMKKHLLLPACLLVLVFSVRAQQPDTAGIIVHYKFSHLPDTTNPQQIHTENMMLLVGKRSTAYKSYDARLATLDVRRQILEQMAANGPDGPLTINQKNTGIGTEYYVFPEENKMIRREKPLIDSYQMAEPIPVINWQISTDTATFGGMHCQKATTHFKGRDYTVWFCPDIPFHGGPWKLSGLPGLILEAYDSKKQVVFKFDGIEEVSKTTASTKPANDAAQASHVIKLPGMDDMDEDPRLIAVPGDAIKTTVPGFAKLKAAMDKDPNAFIGPDGPHMSMPPMPRKPGPQPVENNPIELPEKK